MSSSTGAEAPLLDVRNLQTHFRTPDGVNRAVDGLSFHVNAGETVAIVGESGCGKSVTAMSILRLIPEPPGKIAGEIRFQGKDLVKLSEPEMRAIRGNEVSMIFQEPMTSLNPVLTVARQIGAGRQPAYMGGQCVGTEMPGARIDGDRDRPGCKVPLFDQGIDHVHRQVVHRFVTEVLEAFESGGQTGPGHAGDDHDGALAGRSGRTIGRGPSGALPDGAFPGRGVLAAGSLAGDRPFARWCHHDGSGTGVSEPADSMDAASRSFAGVESLKGARASRRTCRSSSTQVSASGSRST